MTNDLTGAMASSTEDTERPDRTSSVNVGRPWMDLPAKVNVNEIIFCLLPL